MMTWFNLLNCMKLKKIKQIKDKKSRLMIVIMNVYNLIKITHNVLMCRTQMRIKNRVIFLDPHKAKILTIRFKVVIMDNLEIAIKMQIFKISKK